MSEQPAQGLTAIAAQTLLSQPFAGYELQECIGCSGPIMLFRARDIALERTVAVKAVLPHPDRADAVEQFFTEAGSVAGLKSNAIARALYAGQSMDLFFMVYEFVTGESLASRLERRSTLFTEKEAMQLAVQAAELLQALYEKSHPYGCLRPSNLLYVRADDGGQRARLTDIGFAWQIGWASDADAFAARPGYLPPEQLNGELNIDIRGDLWSLGSMLWRVLLGRPALLPGENESPDPRALDPRISAPTAAVLRWLTEPDRSNRPRTPRDLLNRLQPQGDMQ